LKAILAPPTDGSDLSVVADWVELVALFGPVGSCSAEEFAAMARERGWAPDSPDEDVDEELEEWISEADTSPEDPSRAYAEDVFAHLLERADELGKAYPFDLSGDLLLRRAPTWEDAKAYGLMLIVSLLIKYDTTLTVRYTEKGVSVHHLFEKVVQASSKGVLGGSAVRFGVPRDVDWPTDIANRIGRMARELGVDVELLEGKVKSTDGDKTLDVATRLGLGDDGDASVIFMIQCATGRHWEKKWGEPNLTDLQDLLQWRATLVRALAVPWFLPRPEYREVSRRFNGAVVLDRRRLAHGQPDDHLDAYYGPFVTSWCEAQLRSLQEAG
jgi:hypothetical protein